IFDTTNSWTASQYVNGVSMGTMQNFVQNDHNLTGAGWRYTFGSGWTFNGGQADPFGSTQAVQIDMPAGTVSYSAGGVVLTPGNRYVVCAIVRGLVGGEQITMTAGNTGSTALPPITTDWKYLCSTTDAVGSGSTNQTLTIATKSTTAAQSIQIAGTSTTPLKADGFANSGYLPTTTAVTTPTPLVVVGYTILPQAIPPIPTFVSKSAHLGAAGCNLASPSSYDSCTDTVPWLSAFADATYYPSCSGVNPVGGGSVALTLQVMSWTASNV